MSERVDLYVTEGAVFETPDSEAYILRDQDGIALDLTGFEASATARLSHDARGTVASFTGFIRDQTNSANIGKWGLRLAADHAFVRGIRNVYDAKIESGPIVYRPHFGNVVVADGVTT